MSGQTMLVKKKNLDIFSSGFWIKYLLSFGGVRTFSSSLIHLQGWIRKSIPVSREGLTVLKSILSMDSFPADHERMVDIKYWFILKRWIFETPNFCRYLSFRYQSQSLCEVRLVKLISHSNIWKQPDCSQPCSNFWASWFGPKVIPKKNHASGWEKPESIFWHWKQIVVYTMFIVQSCDRALDWIVRLLLCTLLGD